jgi:hypothetical protein
MIQLELFTHEQQTSDYKLQDLFHHLNRKHWNGRLPFYKCEWSNRMISTWGCCYPDQHLIRISSFFKERPLPEVLALLLHEMIHIRYRGHGIRFRNELKRIGLAGDVQRQFPHLSEMTHARRRTLRYIYECPQCHTQIRRRRRIKGYCSGCYSRGITSRFRLKT